MVALQRVVLFGLIFVMVLGSCPYMTKNTNVSALDESPTGDIAEFTISARGTYLHADSYHGGGGEIEGPGIVHLQTYGIVPGDNILISFTGQINKYAGWEPDEPVVYDSVREMIGVFSTDTQLKSIYDVHRVPGAIDAGSDIVNGKTHFGQESMDIPEDFSIAPSTGFWIVVPRNAQYLFICFEDSYYYDNLGSITVTIEKDTDGDGLIDSWERFGLDVDKDGTVDLDLPMLGADFEHKDIFVEGDYMAGRRPRQEAIDDVKAAFANAPVGNPDGIEGINLHVIIDESVPAMGLLTSFDDYYGYKAIHFGTPDERSDPKAIQAKALVFRYCLFVIRIWFDPPNYTCPGVAEGITSDDFILAFGALRDGGSRDSQAAVFMHELGHTLGLRHGGEVDVNYKPNYLSIMNYAFQFDSWKPNRPLDYSHGLCIDLDEGNLSEREGIGYSEVTVWRGPDGVLYTNGRGSLAIDWNNDTVIGDGVHVNLNDDPDHPSPPDEVLTDWNDWDHLVYRFRGTGLATRSATPEDYHTELTTDEIDRMYKEAEERFGYPDPRSGDGKDTGFPIVVVALVVLGAILVGLVLIALSIFGIVRLSRDKTWD